MHGAQNMLASKYEIISQIYISVTCYIVVLYLQNPIKTYFRFIIWYMIGMKWHYLLIKVGQSGFVWCKTSGPE